MIPRRAFIGSLGLGVLALHRRVHAQASAKTPRIAFVGRSPGRELPSFKAFVEGLRSLGYVIGENVVVDVGAPAHDRAEEYSDLAAQFVAAGVDVLVAANPHALDAMRKATKTIPIVGVDLESDPVAKGWISSLARPGGNITGFFLDLPEMSGKQLQLLKEVKPALARVAILGNPNVNELQFRATEVAAQGGGLTLHPLPTKTANEIPGAIAEAARQRAGALLVLSSPLIFANLRRIADAAIKHQLPAINLFVPFFAEAGGLLAYGPDFNDLFRRAAHYADRILKGAKPGDLPGQRPIKFDFVINLKTAKTLGLQIPQSLFLRADRVIE
jgi:putative ABC transport system substrate-binding protein